MTDRPDILTIEISENGETTAKLDYGQLNAGRQDITYEIDWNIIRQLVRKQFAAIRNDNIGEVRKAGDDLRQHLLPKEIRALFPKDGEALLLSTNRHAIPWELLWDGDFLGVRFAMGRQLITRDKIRKLGVHVAMGGRQAVVDEIRKPETAAGIRQKTCLFLTNPTEDLPESRKEAKRLMEYFRNHGIACTLIAGEQITSAEIYSYLRSRFDIVHYSGHIDIDEEKGAYLRLSRKGRFYLSTALTLDDFGRPFVFLNGCGGGPARGSSTKIVRPLIAAGCGPILCATMPITDKGSRLFSEQLIANVLQGMSYGKATMEARKRFLDDPSGGTDWMRFVYYGNPLENMGAEASAFESIPAPIPRQDTVKLNVVPTVPEITDFVVSTDAISGSTDKEGNQGRNEKSLIKKTILFAVILAIPTTLYFMLAHPARETAVNPEKIIIAETVAEPSPEQHEPDEPGAPIEIEPSLTSNTPVMQEIAEQPIPLTAATAVNQKSGAQPTPPVEAPEVKPETLMTIPKAPAPSASAAALAADFYGSWKNGTGIVMEITHGELSRSLDDVTFSMTITSDEPVFNTYAATRANYPSGIRFTGTVTEKGWWIDSPEIGATHSYTLFLHTDCKSFSHNGSSDDGNVYIK